MDFIRLVTWSGLKGCQEKDIKAQKYFMGYFYETRTINQVLYLGESRFSFINFYFLFLSLFLPFFFSSLCNSYNHFIPWLIPSIWFLWALNTHLELAFKSWQSLFRVILKNIVFGSKRVQGIHFFFLDKETRPYIISNHDCFIFKRLTLKQNSMTSNTCQFFFFLFFVFLSFLLLRPPSQVFSLTDPFYYFCPW